MTDMHRTAEWPRLRDCGFLLIHDQPGRITAYMEKPGKRQIRTCLAIGAGFIGFGLMPALNGHVVTGMVCGVVMALLACLIFGPVIVAIMTRMSGFADRVVFMPEEIEFYIGKRKWGTLPREAMQQILADKDQHGLRYHRFIADTGYCSAFPGVDETNHLIVNNVLMSAFGQPVHLDGVAVIAHEQANIAPQIEGLA